jgi:hypothetical protein
MVMLKVSSLPRASVASRPRSKASSLKATTARTYGYIRL